MNKKSSDRKLRNIQRIDYNALHKTGERRPMTDINTSEVVEEIIGFETFIGENSNDESNNTLESLIDPFERLKVKPVNEMSEEIEKMKALQESLQEDIMDYINENPIEDLIIVEDIDNCLQRMEDFRAKYRNNQKVISRLTDQTFHVEHKTEFENTMQYIKNYIIAGKETRRQIRLKSINLQDNEKHTQRLKELEELNRNKQTAEFLLNEVDRMIKELLNEVTEDLTREGENAVTDSGISNKQKKIPSIELRMNNLSDKFKNLLEIIPDTVPDKALKITNTTTRYNALVKNYAKFKINLQNEVDKRELKKEETFKVSMLKIHLPKFKGYESTMDIYTFQEKFENLCLKSTPKRLLPELLKNNYLEGPALDHVKRLTIIDEIWIDLKKAFGDPRMMLMKKLSELEEMSSVFRTRDSEKIKNNLTKVVNVMDELMRIAKVHNIENKLYNGDAIYSIYKILGDSRITKWLDHTCGDGLEGEDLWKSLIEFIDKEI
ncbi:MAG: hypothetical protein MK200_05295 [Nitrosopumilus sp.]|nr:hypothetical protein [Nitrosopumilus sp.]